MNNIDLPKLISSINDLDVFEINYSYSLPNNLHKLSEGVYYCKDTEYYYYFNGKEYIQVLGNNLEEVLDIVRKKTSV